MLATYGLHHGFQYNFLYKMRFKYDIHNKYFNFHLNTLYIVLKKWLINNDFCHYSLMLETSEDCFRYPPPPTMDIDPILKKIMQLILGCSLHNFETQI